MKKKRTKSLCEGVIKSILFLLLFVLGVIILIHILYVFVVPDKIPDKIPADMQQVVDDLNKSSLSDFDYLLKAYDFVNERYTSPSMQYLKEPKKIFAKDLDYLWNNQGYSPCDKQSYVLKVLLVESGRFSEKDARQAFSTCIFTPHYFLKVSLNNGTVINVDMWGADHGYRLGDYAFLNC